MNDEEGPILEDEEKYIIISAMKCLHNLKYIADLVQINQQNSEAEQKKIKLLETLIEEVVKIREALSD